MSRNNRNGNIKKRFTFQGKTAKAIRNEAQVFAKQNPGETNRINQLAAAVIDKLENKGGTGYVHPTKGTPLKSQRLEIDGIKLEVYAGAHRDVIGAVKKQVKDRRAIVRAGIQTYQEKPLAAIIVFSGTVDGIKAGKITKDLFESYLGTGYSMITATKAVKYGHQAWRVVIGENLGQKNVRDFARNLVGISYQNGVLIGAVGEISTNILHANVDGTREIACWPVHAPNQYVVVNGMLTGARFSIAGSKGLAMMSIDGAFAVMPFGTLFENGIKAMAMGTRSIQVPWTELAKLDIGTVNDLSFAFKKDEKDSATIFQLLAVGHAKTAIITLEAKDNTLSLVGKVEYKTVTDVQMGGTVMATLPSGQAVLFDRNGSGNAIIVRDTKGLMDMGFKDVPFAATAATATA